MTFLPPLQLCFHSDLVFIVFFVNYSQVFLLLYVPGGFENVLCFGLAYSKLPSFMIPFCFLLVSLSLSCVFVLWLSVSLFSCFHCFPIQSYFPSCLLHVCVLVHALLWYSHVLDIDPHASLSNTDLLPAVSVSSVFIVFQHQRFIGSHWSFEAQHCPLVDQRILKRHSNSRLTYVCKNRCRYYSSNYYR